ncbi:hypothetical protein HYU06_06105 [Candidatus Woesearchaeota archaeon]|nr:hypothetical protein [Candidatus Woesearchaeota archaeon]
MQTKKIEQKVLFLMILLVFILLATSCSLLKNNDVDKSSQSSSSVGIFGNFFSDYQKQQPLRAFERTGIKALQIDFLKDSPPENVYVGDSFRFGAYVKNIGTADIGANNKNLAVDEGKLILVNADTDAIEVKNSKGEINGEEIIKLHGLSFDNPIGEERIYNFEARVRNKPSTAKTKFILEACYPYETIFSSDVCLATSNDLRLRAAACEMKDISSSNGQGAPVAVTKIVLQKPQKIKDNYYYNFLIYLDNLGQGRVVESNGCSGLEKIYIDNIVLADKAFENNNIKCSLEKDNDEGSNPNKQFIVLKGTADQKIKDRDNIIKCTARFDNTDNQFEKLGDFTTTLKIALKYTYSQSIEKEIVIKDIVGGITADFNQFEGQIPR